MENIMKFNSILRTAASSAIETYLVISHKIIANVNAKRTRKDSSENPTPVPDELLPNILSFLTNPYNALISLETKDRTVSKDLVQIYKETIIKKLKVDKETVDKSSSSDLIFIFHKLNKFMETNHPTELVSSALTMGFSLKQIMSIPGDQLSEYNDQFDAYNIPVDIQNKIANLSETNGRLNLNGQELRTGQLCKILKALTDDQRNALTELYLYSNQLTSLPDSFGRLTALTVLNLFNNQLTSLPHSFRCLTALTNLFLIDNNFCDNQKHAIQQRFNGQITNFYI